MFSNVKGKLGFGLMRLPRTPEGTIDIEETSKMVDMYLDAGFTYFDTAFVYDGSEVATKAALVDRHPRESYQLATKLASWVSPDDKSKAIEQFDTSLERTGAGYFDYYLLHNLGPGRTEIYDKFGLWDWILEQKSNGKIKHAGFSFHSTAENLDKILTAHPEADFVQLQINYADWENPNIQSRACYEVARSHGKEIIVMEPVKGGALSTLPADIAKLLTDYNPDASIASWAIRFAASLPGVGVVLSGMSNTEQMANNLSYMKEFKPLNEEEKAIIEKAREALAKIPNIPCTSCEYCAKVCPENIGISGSFKAYNSYLNFENVDYAKRNQTMLVENQGKKKAGSCIKCGKCEEACPQHIEIRKELERVADTLG